MKDLSDSNCDVFFLYWKVNEIEKCLRQVSINVQMETLTHYNCDFVYIKR